MPLAQSSTGKLYGPDDFSTPPYDVYTANWTLDAGTVAIEAGQLSLSASGGGTSGIVKSVATYSGGLVLGGEVTVTAGRVITQWHIVGSNYYQFYIEGNGASVTARLSRYAGAVSLDTATVACVLGVTYTWKVIHIGSAISIYWDGVEILSATDATYTSGQLRLRGYDATVNTAHVHYDNIYVCTTNSITCSGLPTGWDLVVGTKTAAASGGTATVDLANLPLPASALYIKNSADATKWSWGETWGGDIYALAQGRVIELYEAEGTGGAYLKDLPATQLSGLTVDRTRTIRRDMRFTVPLTSLADVKPVGRQVKVYSDADMAFWGYIESRRASVDMAGSRYDIDVYCLDKTSRVKKARFSVDTPYEDLDAKETPNQYSTATASTALAIGDPIQQYGLVYSHTLVATVLGVAADVTEDATFVPATVTDPKQRILQGSDFSVTYAEDGLTSLSYTVYVDMRVTENVGDIHVTTGGTLGTVYVSTDGESWAAFAAGSFRFIKFTITKAAGPITCSVVIDSGAAYPATNVAADNGNSWRPTAADTDRTIDVTMAATVTVTGEAVATGDGVSNSCTLFWFPITPNSQVIHVADVLQAEGVDYSIVDATGTATFLAGHIPTQGQAVTAPTYTFPYQGCNVLYLRHGVNSFDRTTRYVYDLYMSADGVTGWTLLEANCEATSSYLREHRFTFTANRFFRIRYKGASGPVALRYVAGQYVLTTGVSVAEVVQDIATDAGETLFRVTATRLWVKPTTFTAGSDRWALQELAASVGWEAYYSADGYFTFAPPDVDITDPDIPTYEAMFNLEAEWNDAEIYNEAIGVHESSSGIALRSVQRDDNAFSATGIPRIGVRTAPVQYFPLADTQQKLDAATLAYLQQVSRQRVQVSFRMEGVTSHEAGDVIHLHESLTGLDGYFTLESFTVTEDPARGDYSFDASVVQEVT